MPFDCIQLEWVFSWNAAAASTCTVKFQVMTNQLQWPTLNYIHFVSVSKFSFHFMLVKKIANNYGNKMSDTTSRTQHNVFIMFVLVSVFHDQIRY